MPATTREGESADGDDGCERGVVALGVPRVEAVADLEPIMLFLATFRGMPTANAEGWIESEGSIGKGAEQK